MSAVGTLVVDDEPIARAGLRHTLAQLPWLHCVGEAANGEDALTLIAALKPELLILDIRMPGLSGTALLQQLRQRGGPVPHVIFTTAFAEHAVEAFELGAIDYLLKPFSAERLVAALERARAAFGEPLPSAIDRYAELLAAGPIQRLFVRSGRRIVPLAVAEVRCFEAVGDYVSVHAESASHLVHLSLNRLERRLDAERFLRVHRSWIVNLDQVAAFRRGEGGALQAELRGGRVLPVSRSVAQGLRGQAR